MIPRAVAALIISSWLFPVTASAELFGHPGAPTPAFSMRASAGLGYTDRDLDNNLTLRDDVRRIKILGRVSFMLLDWLEFGGTLIAADARRSLTKFSGDMGVGGGTYVRFYPMLQEKFGLNIAIGGGFNMLRNTGDSPTDISTPGARASDLLRQREYHGELILSRSFKIWNLYGGITYNHVEILQDNIPAGRDPALANVNGSVPVGLVVGVDYYVTPLVYFSIEGQNFHEDTISAGIGVLLAPHMDDREGR